MASAPTPPFISGPARYPFSALSTWYHQKIGGIESRFCTSAYVPSSSLRPVITTSTSGTSSETAARIERAYTFTLPSFILLVALHPPSQRRKAQRGRAEKRPEPGEALGVGELHRILDVA